MVAGGCLRVEEGASRPLRDHVAVSSWEEGARRGHQGSAAFSGGSRVVPCVWADDGPDECKRRRTRQTRFHSEQEVTQASTISASDCAKETGYHDAGCDRRRSRRRHRRRRSGSAKVQRGGRGGALPPATAVGVTLRDVGLGAGSRTAVQGTTAADAAGRWGRRQWRVPAYRRKKATEKALRPPREAGGVLRGAGGMAGGVAPLPQSTPPRPATNFTTASGAAAAAPPPLW